MSDVGSWFSARRQKRIREEIVRHSEHIIETVSEFVKFASKWADESTIDEGLFQRIANIESEADGIRRKILDLLAEAEMDPGIRTYLARIVRQVDWVADWALEAARLMTLIPPDGVCPELRQVALKMLNRVLDTAKATHESILMMFKDPIATLDLADRVERLEEEVDDLYQEARRVFLYKCSNLTPVFAIVTFHLLDAIEMMADKCEDTCDCIREFVVRKW